jgi:peptide/nickel transport system substrate-binding protein
MRRRGLFGGLLLAVCAACSPGHEITQPALRIAVHSDPLALDPYRHNEALTFSLLRNVFEPLTSFDARMQVGPSLATSWENPDDSTWIFHLRPGVRFHDGQPFGAPDVVWSLNRARLPEASSFASYLVSVANVRAIDDLTLMITTKGPYPILLNKLAFVAIVPRGSPVPIERPVGTGPYEFVSFAPGKGLALEAFDGYWGVPPEERQVEFVPVADRAERLRLLEERAVDVAQDPGQASADRLTEAMGLRLVRGDGLLVIYLLLRHDRPPLDDLRVRQAIDLAIDRQGLVEELWRGYATPVGQLVSRNAFGYSNALVAPARDLERARALLTAAGHPDGLDLEVEFRADRETVAAALARQLAEAGIRVRATGSPWAELFPRLRDGGLRQAYIGGVLAASADASDVFDGMVHSRDPARGYGDNNHAGYRNEMLDKLIEESGSTLDMLSRRHLLEECSALLAKDSVYLPLFAPYTLYGARQEILWQPRLDGWILASGVTRSAPRAAPATPR